MLFGAFIANLFSGPRGAGVPSNPLQLSEAALAYCIVSAIIVILDGLHSLMGYPLFGEGAAEAFTSAPAVVHICDVISLIQGIGAIVVLQSKRSRGIYAGLLTGQAVFWAAAVVLNYVWLVRDIYRHFYPATVIPGSIVAIAVFAFALTAWAPSVGQWFSGVPAPVAVFPAPGVNFGGPVMAAAPAPVAVPQQITKIGRASCRERV